MSAGVHVLLANKGGSEIFEKIFKKRLAKVGRAAIINNVLRSTFLLIYLGFGEAADP